MIQLLRRYLPLGAAAALLIVFGLLADEVVEGSTLTFDRAVLLWYRTPGDVAVPIGPLWLLGAVRGVASLGSFSILGLITILAVLQRLLSGDRKLAAYVGMSVVTGTLVSSILKVIFDRPRPDIPGAPHVFTASFASGHATLSAIVFLTLAAVLAAATTTRRLKIFYAAAGAVLTCVVGISRIYKNKHNPTDVLAGWLVGTGWATLCWIGARRLTMRSRNDQRLPRA